MPAIVGRGHLGNEGCFIDYSGSIFISARRLAMLIILINQIGSCIRMIDYNYRRQKSIFSKWY